MKIILIIMLILMLMGYIRWRVTSDVLTAWIAENDGCETPTKEDIARLTKWVIRKRLGVKSQF